MQEDLRHGLKLYMSNNMESLGDICAILMSEYPLKSPFDHEKIVIMNLGMKTFVTQRIALQNGINALCDFQQMWQLIFEVNKQLNATKSEEIVKLSLYDRQHLTWNIFTQMSLWAEQANAVTDPVTDAGADAQTTAGAAPEPIYARLMQYLEDDRFGDKAYELASKIADTLDSYQMYRPNWIIAWNKIPLRAFNDYERDPDDPDNPINQFIESECKRFVRAKTGFAQKPGMAAAASSADAVAKSADASTPDSQSAVANLGQEVDAQALKAALSDDEAAQRVTAERVKRVRALFKSNVWQIKLWCLLRYNYAFTNVKGQPLGETKPAEFDWLLRNLDRAQVMTALIAKLKALAPVGYDDEGQPLYPRFDLSQPEMARAFVDAHEYENTKVALASLYQRVFVFGVSAMPRIVVDFLDALALHCNVNVMLLNPCQEYWADLHGKAREDFEAYVKLIQSHTTSAHDLKLDRPKVTVPSFDLKGQAAPAQAVEYLPLALKSLVPSAYDAAGERVEGHPLLLSYGKQGRDNLYLFYDRDPVPSNIACFSEPDLPNGGDFSDVWVQRQGRKVNEVRGGTLLTFLQHQLLNLEQPKERYIISPDDVSLSVHSCHTKRREVEVLHDAILACFNRARLRGETLYPRDIVVMVPTINDYAPHVSAVFGGQYDKSDPDYIPFVISDRAESEANTVAQSLLKLLEIGTERITSVLVTELLSEGAIARRFGLGRDQVEVIVRWLNATNVYWGLDAHDVSPLAQIVIPGTFASGMERMILGALMGETDLPCWSEIEGSDTIILGKFWDFLQALRELRARFTPELALTPAQWSTELNKMLTERFFDDAPDTTQALKSISTVIDNLKETIAHLEHKPRINLPVFAAALRQGLTAQRNFLPFLRDKVNFCSLVPMRAVPFKHIFILGLNDMDFPREERAPNFNLIANKELFARGDRSRGIDDRYLFLEALISARESIYFSYIGQSPTDKSALNPSIVLSELIFYLGDSCAVEGLENIKESERPDSVKARLCVNERLNAYDELNFHAAHYPNALPTSKEEAAATIAAYQQRLAADDNAADDNAAKGNAAEDNAAKGNEGDGSAGAARAAKDNAAKSKAGSSAAGAAAEAAAGALNLELYRRAVQTQRAQLPSFKRDFILLKSKTLKRERELLGAGVFKPDMSALTHQLVELDKLRALMADPAKSFMTNVLEIRLDPSEDDTLTEDEAFELDYLERHSLISELIALPPQQRRARLQRKAHLGQLPYGLFFNQLSEQLDAQMEGLNTTLSQEFGLEHTSLLLKRECPHTIWQLTLPRSFFSSNAPLDFGAIGADLAQMQADSGYVPGWLQGLSESEVYHFELTLQSSCYHQPIVIAGFNRLSTSQDTKICGPDGAKLALLEAAVKKPKVVYSALREAIGQYCYDGGLRAVSVVDSEGKLFTLKALEREKLRALINTWLVCYLVSQSRPLPIAPYLITKLAYNDKGERTYEQVAIEYDKYSTYLFNSFSDLARYPELYDCAWAYHDFYLEELAPYFVLGAEA